MRREIPAIILFVTGLIIILERFFNLPVLSSWGQGIRTWGVIVAAFAVALSSINLIVIHVRNIRTRRIRYTGSALLVGLAGMAVLGIIGGTTSTQYRFWYDSLLSPMASTMFAMLAFYIGSAAYRAFIAKRAEAAVLLVSAILLMIANVPIGEMLHPRYGEVASWITNIPNLAGQRGMMIASAIGAMSASLRVLIGIDKTHFGGGE